MKDILSNLEKIRSYFKEQTNLDKETLGRSVFFLFLKRISRKYEINFSSQSEQFDYLSEHGSVFVDNILENIKIETLEGEPQLIDKIYLDLVPHEVRRESGQFITPFQIASFMSSLIPEDVKTILDAGTGTGIFLEAIAKRNFKYNVKVVAIDKDPLVLDAAKINARR